MGHYGLLANWISDDPAKDIRGRTLYGLEDEKLGQINDVVFDHSTGNISYIVIDTGGWLRTKRFIVSAEHLRPSTKHHNDFICDLTKPQIESLPPYDDSCLHSHQAWAAYGSSRARAERSEGLKRAG
jgi:sporulation protein YlmC with PRC-barrel domain